MSKLGELGLGCRKVKKTDMTWLFYPVSKIAITTALNSGDNKYNMSTSIMSNSWKRNVKYCLNEMSSCLH
jgi:hypothetical protein